MDRWINCLDPMLGYSFLLWYSASRGGAIRCTIRYSNRSTLGAMSLNNSQLPRLQLLEWQMKMRIQVLFTHTRTKVSLLVQHKQYKHLENGNKMIYTMIRGTAFAVVYGCRDHPYARAVSLPPFSPAALICHSAIILPLFLSLCQ